MAIILIMLACAYAGYFIASIIINAMRKVA